MSKIISSEEYKRRGQKAAATKLANKLKAETAKNAPTIAPVKKVQKKVVDLKTQIELNNEKFNNSTPAEKRVLVALDVIAQIKNNKYIPNTGEYISGMSDINREADVQELFLKDKLPQCKVCGLGACILSIAHLGDSLSVFDIHSLSPDATDKMLEVFGAEQAALIETAFEGGEDNTYPWSETLNDGNEFYYQDIKGIHEASLYYDEYKSEKARLLAIMKNIVRNKGVFKPEEI